jgi:hypothetical protein
MSIQASASNDIGQGMEQVYIFKNTTIKPNTICKVKLEGFAHDGRDVYLIFTNGALTATVVVREVFTQHYIPWMKKVRRRFTGADTATIFTSCDSDPEQYTMLTTELKPMFKGMNARVSHTAICIRQNTEDHLIYCLLRWLPGLLPRRAASKTRM